MYRGRRELASLLRKRPRASFFLTAKIDPTMPRTRRRECRVDRVLDGLGLLRREVALASSHCSHRPLRVLGLLLAVRALSATSVARSDSEYESEYECEYEFGPSWDHLGPSRGLLRYT